MGIIPSKSNCECFQLQKEKFELLLYVMGNDVVQSVFPKVTFDSEDGLKRRGWQRENKSHELASKESLH